MASNLLSLDRPTSLQSFLSISLCRPVQQLASTKGNSTAFLKEPAWNIKLIRTLSFGTMPSSDGMAGFGPFQYADVVFCVVQKLDSLQDISSLSRVNRAFYDVVLRPLYRALVARVEKDDRSMLHLAAERGWNEFATRLIEFGASVDKKDAFGRAPLFFAASNGNLGVSKVLLERGADINLQGPSSQTPFHTAVHNGHKEVVEFLIRSGCRIYDLTIFRETALALTAHAEGSVEMANLLLGRSFDIEAKNIDGMSVLHLAVWNASHRMAAHFIKRGASLESRSYNDEAPLATAVRNYDLKMAKLLLQAGADPTTACRYGLSVVLPTIRLQNAPMLQTFFDHGLDVKGTHPVGQAALYDAICKKDASLVRVLVQHGVDVSGTSDFLGATGHRRSGRMGLETVDPADEQRENRRKRRGKIRFLSRPLHWAVSRCRDHAKVVEELLAGGANTEALDRDGNTPLLLVSGDRQISIARALIEGGANPDAQDSDGNTLLHHAWICCFHRLGNLLRDKGANLELRNKDGKTIYDLGATTPWHRVMLRERQLLISTKLGGH